MPGYKAGGPVSSVYNLVNHLKEFFQFYIITRNSDYTEEKPYENIIPNQWTDFDTNTKVFYLSKENVNKKFIRTLINSINQEIAYINGIYSFYFSIVPLLIVKNNKKIKPIVCARGMLSEQAFSRKSLKKNFFLSIAKIFGLYKNITFHATSESESTDILKKIFADEITEKRNIFVIPNFAKKIETFNYKQPAKKTMQLKLVSIARISQEKNTKFALECLLNITEGEVIFDLYGTIYDTNYWNDCLNIIKLLPKNIHVNYKADISNHKVINTFAEYDFAFMPSVGENFGHSILESFFAGTPVIISNRTPWRNLQQQKIGWDLALENKEMFIKVINNCIIMSQNEYKILADSAVNFAKKTASNQETIFLYKEMFNLLK